MKIAWLCALAAALVLAFAANASAATFNVTTTADNANPCNPGDCSLRGALAAADATPGEDTVNVPAGHYVLTLGELHIDEIDDTLHIVGAGARSTIIDGGGQFRVFNIDDGHITMSHITITGGHAQDQGGGIFENDQDLTLDHVAVVGNTVVTNNEGGFGAQGGGIFANEALTMTNSVVANNTADGTGATFSGAQGGGIFGNEPLTLTNVTVSNNIATPAVKAQFSHAQGGGIFINEVSTFQNVTIAGNQASGDDAGGGIFINEDMTLINTLLSGNTVDGAPQNCVNNNNTLTENHNLESGTDCGFTGAGDIQNANPALGALADNGGETDTQALVAGSPAVDTADGTTCPTTDQRDLPRPALGGCDIGAFELQPPPPPPPTPAPAPAKDTTKPAVSVAGVRRACVSSNMSIRIRANDASGVASVRVTLDGKRLKVPNRGTFRLRINVHKLRAGRHVLRIVTTDKAGNRTTIRRTIARCAVAPKAKRRVAPRFTG